MTVALVDVHYEGSGARAACVLTGSWDAELALDTYVLDIPLVEPYEPGSFYRRELPCLLAVLRLPRAQPDVVIIDGYVWLASLVRPGLGAHLYDALDKRVAVVGVAKTAFVGAKQSDVVASVYRGSSARRLFVTAAGMDLKLAAERVRRMAGKHRIPDLARRVDHLARQGRLSVRC